MTVAIRARHNHIDLYAGVSLCIRRVGGVTAVRLLIGKTRTLKACIEAILAEEEQRDITRMATIAKNSAGSTGNKQRF